jgi:hypothetical protein
MPDYRFEEGTEMRISGELKFPPLSCGFACIFYFENEGAKIPFYVGEGASVHMRVTDYFRKQFACATDFNVGTAAGYLRSKGYLVKVRYWQTSNREWEESQEISGLRRKGFPLLNGQLGYKYQPANRAQQQARVHAYVDTILMPLHSGEEQWKGSIF